MAEKKVYDYELRKIMEILGLKVKEFESTLQAVEVMANLAGRTLLQGTDKVEKRPELADFAYDEEGDEPELPLDTLRHLAHFLEDSIVKDIIQYQLSDQWELPTFNNDLQRLKELIDILHAIYQEIYEQTPFDQREEISARALYALFELMDSMQDLLKIYIAGRTSVALMQPNPLGWLKGLLWPSKQENKPKR